MLIMYYVRVTNFTTAAHWRGEIGAKHDMMVSIRAGFQVGELGWSIAQNTDWQEKRSWEGGLRSKVVRR